MSVRWRHVIGALSLLAVIAYASTLRIVHTLHDPSFDRASAAGLLRTDPAFLYYVIERIVESGGAVPTDLRADPRPEWPETTDIAAIETVGQEFYVAWTYLALGRGMPLHVWCVWAMGLFASLVAVGVYGAAYELGGRVRWAVAAAVLWSTMLGNYRTLGFVLMREDFALPWFGLHAWLVLRSARVRTPTSFVLAGLSAAAAAATWHAMVFVLSMEALCVLLWFLRSGVNPFASRSAWLVPATTLAGSVLVPVLRAKQFALSLPMQIALGLTIAGFVSQRRAISRRTATALALGSMVVLLGLSRAMAVLTSSGLTDYSHVFALLIAKLRYLGRMPDDPRSLPFAARLLWHGPFETGDFLTFARGLTAACVALIAATLRFVPATLRGDGPNRATVVFLFTAAAAFSTWLIGRTAPLFGFAGSVLSVVVLDGMRRPRLGALAVALACIAHASDQQVTLSGWVNTWYLLPPSVAENARLMSWISRNVPDGDAIAADYTTSAAILAHTRHPILLQPKYETVRSRERIESFCRALYQGTPEDFARFLRQHRCRWLVVNRPWIASNAALLGGILPTEQARSGDRAVGRFLSERPDRYANVPGFTIVYRSSQDPGRDLYRVYRLE